MLPPPLAIGCGPLWEAENSRTFTAVITGPRSSILAFHGNSLSITGASLEQQSRQKWGDEHMGIATSVPHPPVWEGADGM